MPSHDVAGQGSHRQRTLPSLSYPRLLSCHGTSATSPEKGNSWCRSTRLVLLSTRVSRTLLSSSSSSSHNSNSPSRVLMQVERRRSLTVARKLQDHAHIAFTTFFGPTMIADTPTAVDPCFYAHQLLQLYQGQGGPVFDSRIKEAFTLADQLEVIPSCKTIFTLNAHISAPSVDHSIFDG